MKKYYFELRHSIQPYAVTIGVLCLIFLLTLWAGLMKNIWSGAIGIIILGTIYLLGIYFYDLRYRIFFQDDTIFMQYAVWFPNEKDIVAIKISDVTKMRCETSNIDEVTTMRRATQRIAIYDEVHQKFIDVSLKHFKKTDIDKLIMIIQEKRPDLVVDKR